MRCETCHGTGWQLHCPERLAGCPYKCSPRCRLGTCPDCNGEGDRACPEPGSVQDDASGKGGGE